MVAFVVSSFLLREVPAVVRTAVSLLLRRRSATRLVVVY